jgi:GH25 family lysozyme M1 (1,4-beta-N-acetylmuramidase)
MSTTVAMLESELVGEEKAIRLLIGEQAALTSKLKREHALEVLTSAELKKATTRGPVVATVDSIPHEDRFPDVSNWQPTVDWDVVRQAGSVRVGQLAITKLTEGTTLTDAYGAGRLRLMAAAGFPHRGGYHFLHPAESPRAQAEHFLEVAHSDGVVIRESDVLVCDAEVSDGQRAATVRQAVAEFGAIVKAETPAKVWLYGGGPFIRENGITLSGYDGHWLGAYVVSPAPFEVFGARTVAWQYTNGTYGPAPRVCPGIGSCDLSIVL